LLSFFEENADKFIETSVRATIVFAALHYEQAVGAGNRKAARSNPRYSISFHAGLNWHASIPVFAS
jgi:hypothetical protein